MVKRRAKRKGSGLAAPARLVLVGVLIAGLGASWFWWTIRSWMPDAAEYPEQGVAIGEGHALVGFETVRALGGRFAYLAASRGSEASEKSFSLNLARARAAGLKVGAIHFFDPCESADRQSANFVTIVPRDSKLLPPAIALVSTADHCTDRISDAAVESELMTLVNQIEMHSSKRVILKLSRAFEERYHVAMALQRDLWLMRDRFEPDYAARPWLLWSANRSLVSDASSEPIEWVVVQK